ncbi:MAG: alpha-1,4-glucan--maltose-1-phosphate maltosyltransferase [Chloroherpetonaceae bacterium]|nr:alpha-1,4-glucan--maltose-1-phosphate maltosyltransferase [Chloroherpetonaceae bacterium]
MPTKGTKKTDVKSSSKSPSKLTPTKKSTVTQKVSGSPKRIESFSNFSLSKPDDGRARPIIERMTPELDGGLFPIKRVPNEKVKVEVDIFSDGHDKVLANLLFRHKQREWESVPLEPMLNDRWCGEFLVSEIGTYEYTVEAWVDHFATWRAGFEKKYAAGVDIELELQVGKQLIETAFEACKKAGRKEDMNFLQESLLTISDQTVSKAASVALSEELNQTMLRYPDKNYASRYKTLRVTVDPMKASFSTWYEFFPRSYGENGKHGTFKDCEKLLPEIERMGFDVIYLPPIHPIGITKRKGKNNNVVSKPGEPGSPWAIGSKEGGHKSIHPELGTVKEFETFVQKARLHKIDIALDIAFQCSPDHPYVKEHPSWFKWRPDGTVQHAENPPKKYEDVLPFNFETEDWEALWEELRSIFYYWIERGVTIFRVDNPHTKTLGFWDWCIGSIKEKHPETIFLAEAFTRPKLMYRLAKGGFTHSYTYFTWRNNKQGLTEYLTELTTTEVKEYFRPNFWPNTPDILSEEYLHNAPRAAFVSRYALAATLSSNIGIYGPAYELCINTPLIKGKEEYLDSEKYELKQWEWNAEGNIREFISKVNKIRKENPSLQKTNFIRFLSVNQGYSIENQELLAYLKYDEEQKNVLLCVVNLDPHHSQSGWVFVPNTELGLGSSYTVKDLLTDRVYQWNGEWNYVELNPQHASAHILKLK